jgi:hypothetical protein
MEKNDPPLGSVMPGRRLENSNQVHQWPINAKNGILTILEGIVKKIVMDESLSITGIFFITMRDDHVVKSLECGSGNPRILANQV